MVLSKYELLIRDFCTCQRCGKTGNMDTLQRAHHVRQGKQAERTVMNFIQREYGQDIKRSVAKKILDDEQNISIACDKCNSYFNIFNNPMLRDEKIRKIYEKEFLDK